MIITFQNFLLSLAQGQLKNIAAADKSQGGYIKPDYIDTFLKLTNQGLLDLTTKKKLFEETAILTLVTGQNIYPLDTSNGADFENMVRVIDVVTDDERSHTTKTSVHIRQPNPETLRFSDTFIDYYGANIDINFQVHHPLILSDGEINLPAHLHEVLALYVSGLYLAHMGGEEHKVLGDSLYGLYLKKCNDDTIENSSNLSEVTDEDSRFYDRGFI